MELHSLDRITAVTQAHDGAAAVFFGGPGADFQFGGQIFFLDDERMIARGRHGHGKALEDGSVVVHDCAGLAMHEMSGANHASAEGFADRLMSEADSEHWDFSCEVADELDADACFMGRAGPWRDDDLFRSHLLDLANRDLIVAANFDFCAQFAEVLDQVVGERIVIVEYENQARTAPAISLHRTEILNLKSCFYPLNGPPIDPRVVLTPALTRRILFISSTATSRHFGGCMAEPQQEKRGARRFPLRVPVTVDHENAKQAAQLRDVSARGISFYLESVVTQGSPIGFTLTLPPEITLTESIRVQCKGRVVRVDDTTNDGKLAVAAVIEEYEFLPEA